MRISKLMALAIALTVTSVLSFGQGSGKVQLHGKIETFDQLKNMQVSVLDLASHEVIDRQEIVNNFWCTLPLQGRYMVYFKKESHPTTRLILDTHVPTDNFYFVQFDLNLTQDEESMQTGISLAAGTLKFDTEKGAFTHELSETATAGLIAISHQITGEEVARF